MCSTIFKSYYLQLMYDGVAGLEKNYADVDDGDGSKGLSDILTCIYWIDVYS